MATYDIGIFIRQIRRERCITQEQLCKGLCSKSTMSKIERGQYTPSNYLFDALMERLGCFSRKYITTFLAKDDYVLWQNREALTGALHRKDVAQAESIIEQLWEADGFYEGLGRQFLLIRKAALGLTKADAGDAQDLTECKSWAYEAVKITIPDFDDEKITEYMLSYEETLAINCIAGVEMLENNFEQAAYYYNALKECQDKFCLDQSEKAKCYPGILANLILCLYELESYEKAAEICILGKRFCIKWGKSLEIMSIMESYCKCLVKLGKIKEAEPIIRHAYGAAITLGQGSYAEAVSGLYRETYGTDLS